MQLSLVLPCFNEEANIEQTVHACSDWMAGDNIEGEIIAVNDGSSDGTLSLLERVREDIPSLRIVNHEVNKGYGAAVTTGCDAASTEWIAFMDSDGQFDPLDFRRLTPFIEEFSVITGRRLKRADPFKRRMMAKVFGFLVFLVLGLWVRDVNCAMKLYKKDVWKLAHPRIATGGLFNAELFYRLKKNGIAWKQVPVPHYPRKAGVQTGGNVGVVMRALRELWRLRGQRVSE